MNIYTENLQNVVEYTNELDGLVERAVKETLKQEKIDFDVEVSVMYVDNEQIHKINKEHRGIDRPTDVLSFPMIDFDAPCVPSYDLTNEIDPQTKCVPIGDIVISLEKAKEQAELYGHSIEREIAFLTIHSMLHLLGYDHETSSSDEETMFKRQDVILAELGITR